MIRPWLTRHALALSLALLGCGGAVRPLDIHDPRLPTAARRQVADAEDAVVVARARLADARAEAAAAGRAAAQLGPELALGPATEPLRALAAARRAARAAATAVAAAELDYAEARLRLTYAETAARHDLALTPLAPLSAAVETTLDTLQARRAAARQAEAAAEAQADAFWAAFRRFTAEGGDTRAFWLLGAAP